MTAEEHDASMKAVWRQEFHRKTLQLVQELCPHWPIHEVPVRGLSVPEARRLQLRDAIQKIVRPDLEGQALDDCVDEWDAFKHDQVATLLNLRRKNGNLAYQFGREQTLDEVLEDLADELSGAGSW